jgi:hypothetical protein
MSQNPFPQDLQNQNQIAENPFISEENQMLNSLIQDKSIPKELAKKYWFVFAKDNKLTFLDKERKKNKLLAFDILKLDEMMNQGYYEYNFNNEKEFNEIRLIFDTILDRSLGTSSTQQLNERIIQKSQFAESRSFVSDSNQSVKGKFFQRLIGR